MSIFAQKLKFLFETKLNNDGRKITKKEVSQKTGIDKTYLYRLLKPDNGIDNPSYGVITSLSKIFNVAPEYFFDDSIEKSEFSIREDLHSLIGFTHLLERNLRNAGFDELTKDAKMLSQAQKDFLITVARLLDEPKANQIKAQATILKLLNSQKE